jgi:hypothetical protein
MNVSGMGMLEDPQKQRTESFKETLDASEFKREQKKGGPAKQGWTTQKLFNRNQMFNWGAAGKKKDPNHHAPPNPRLSKKEIEHLSKDDLYFA